MTDIERLREAAAAYKRHYFRVCESECVYEHGWCAVLSLLELLEKAEQERYKAIEVCQAAVSALGDVEDELEKAKAQLNRLFSLVKSSYAEGLMDGENAFITERAGKYAWVHSYTKETWDKLRAECKTDE